MNLDDLYRLLRSSHVQAQGIIDTLQEPLLVLDQSGCIINGNRAFFEKFSIDRHDAIDRSLFALGQHQWDIAELRRLLKEVVPKSLAIIGFEVADEFPPLGRRTMLISARRLAHPDNNSTSILMVFEDVTEQQRKDAEKDILLGETRHRMKNLLAIVRAIAAQTTVEGRTGEEYRDAFLARFEAVECAEDLSLIPDAEADLNILVERALERVSSERRHVVPGPVVLLQKAQILPFSLILHELTTNAFKYGALSTMEGQVQVTWKVETVGNQKALHFFWIEEGGPPVSPPGRTGFGSRLIECSAAQYLNGSAEMRYERGGLEVNVIAPLT